MAQQKVSFKKWWKNITGTKAVRGLFHIDLVDSIVYAGVPVHYTVNGQRRCQGYIPTIVSKCGWLLKEQATKTKGIFRVSGSAKRVAELQLIFDTPPKYGSQLDWTGYTIHDASNVLRRYLNHLPDPVIPLEFYEKFRDVHRNLTNDEEKIAAYQELISKLPPPHSCLLMYLLDLLALFAHHSEENLMDSKNLASVFQPGVISHPNHAMSPGEYMTSAAVLKFLIDYQSSFTMPTPNIDEEDEEMANFGLMNHPPQNQLPTQTNMNLGYVSASDHERIHSSADRGISFEADDAVHILNSGVRRQLSLHKPIIPHSTLPGNRPQRSKSTNSSTSSHHSNPSGLFSSSLIPRRRSNRNSKTGSKIFNGTGLEGVEQEQDLSDIPENTQTAEEKSQQLTPRSSMIRKAVASPVIGSDDTSREFPSYFTRRKQLKAEGPHREPSVFYQTIEIQFPAPIGTDNPMPFKSTTSMSPTASSSLPPILPRGDRSTQNTSNLSGRGGPTRTPSGPTVAHAPPLRQRDSYSSPQIVSNRPNLGQKRVSGSGQSLQAQAAAYNTTAARRPTNPGMPILRAKSNPGDLSGAGMKDRPYGLSSSHSAGGSQAIEKFMGLFTGKHRDHDSSSSKDSDSKDGKKDKKRDSFTDKQRKYKSQEVNPSHLQGFASSGRKGAPVHGTINENEERPYAQPPPPRPMQQSGTAPQRPPPPPPEGSLMDLLDPPQRIGYHSGQSTPSGGSRSNSPARAPSASRHPLPANTSFTSTSSARSTSSGDRLYHGRGLPSHGSSSSLEMLNPGLRPEDEHYARKRSPRPGHSPQVDSHGHVLYDNHLYHQQQHKQHLASHPHSRQQHQQQHGAHSPHPGYEYGGNNTAGYFQPPQMSSPALSPRSRQGSFGSVETYDSNAPTPTPKSKDRKLPREGSSPSILRDHHNGTPSKERSNSSKTSSPHHSPALGPLSRAASNQGGYGYTQQQQQQQHGSSPLAEGYGATSYGSLSPSSRARTRAQSRDEQHLLHRQESGSIAHAHAAPRPPYYERERSRSGTGLTISTMTSGLVLASAPVSAHSSPAMPPVPTTSSLSSVTHHHNSNNSSVSLASTSSTASRSLGPGRYAAPPPSG